MEVAPQQFNKTLATGRVGESRIARWLISRGWAVLPVYEKVMDSGKGPQLFTLDRQLVAPDMLAFRSKNPVEWEVKWIEAKTKSVFSWHRITERWVTGIDLKHYRSYLEVAMRSPWPVWLLFLHECSKTDEGPGQCPTGLFGHELLYLAGHENHTSDKWGNGGMVYWAHETLMPIANLNKLGV